MFVPRRSTVSVASLFFVAGATAQFAVVPARAGTIFRVSAALTTGANDGSSWQDAFQGRLGLAQALGAATSIQDTVQIWVAAGTYAPAGVGGSADSTLAIPSGVGVYGGFSGVENNLSERDAEANITTLSGELIGVPFPNSHAHHVVRFNDADASAVLDGFTVRDGNAGNSNIFTDGSTGGGVAIFGGNPTIRHCEFRENESSHGAGVGIFAGAPLIEDCRFIENRTEWSGGGLGNFQGGAPTIRRCRFESNIGGQGCGLYNGPRHPFHDPPSTGSPTITDCDFINNMGHIGAASGIGLRDDGGAPRITRCRFIGNSTQAGGGAMYLQNSAASIVSCDIVNNEAPGDGGGGVYVDGSVVDGGEPGSNKPQMIGCRFIGNNGAVFSNFNGDCELINCTIANNSIGNPFLIWPAVLCQQTSSMTLKNCLIWGNQPFNSIVGVQAIIFGGGNVTVDNSCVERWDGTYAGSGTFDLDPLLAIPAGPDGIPGTEDDNVRLTAASPCLNSANADDLPGDTNDLDADGDFAEALPHDLDGATRLSGCGLDIGAFEFPAPLAHSGDLNADGQTNVADVPVFIDALLSASTDCIGDLNADGETNGLDIQPFVLLLLS